MAERNGVDILLATGGSGGHIYPATAVGHEFVQRGYSVAMIGQAGGMEERIAEEERIPFYGVPAGRWNRGGIPNPLEVLRAVTGVFAARRIVRSLAPKVVIGFGGFASYAGAAAAPKLGIPLVLHEANTVPSLVNRQLAARANLVVVAREEAVARLTGAKQHVVLPYPVREERVERAAAVNEYGLAANRPVVLIMGGSQGSLPLNRLMPRVAERFAGTGVQFLHSTGRNWLAEVQHATAHLSDYHVREYVHAPTAWAAASFAVTRSGMGTITEAAFHAVPLIMMPLPGAADDHQLKNAEARAREGAGIVVPQGALDETTENAMQAAILQVLNEDTQRAMRYAAAQLNPAGAASDIVSAVVKSQSI